jgi:hypothetical protein
LLVPPSGVVGGRVSPSVDGGDEETSIGVFSKILAASHWLTTITPM